MKTEVKGECDVSEPGRMKTGIGNRGTNNSREKREKGNRRNGVMVV